MNATKATRLESAVTLQSVTGETMPRSCPNPTLAVVRSIESLYATVCVSVRYLFENSALCLAGCAPVAAFQIALWSRIDGETIECCLRRLALGGI